MPAKDRRAVYGQYPDIPQRTCLQCGTLYAPYHRTRQKFCSDRCGKLYRWVDAGHPARKVRVVGDCGWCGERMKVPTAKRESPKDAVSGYHRACLEPLRAARLAARTTPRGQVLITEPLVRNPPETRLAVPEVTWNGSVR